MTGERFTTEELVDTLTRAVADPAAQRPIRLILDNRQSKESSDYAEIRRRAGMFAEHGDLFHDRIAVVVSDALHFGIARMGEAFIEPAGKRLRIFEDPDEALAWLGK